MKALKETKNKTVLAALAALLALLLLSGASFAWFSFNASATVQEMQGRISDKGVNLVISNSEAGPFDTSCELIPESKLSALTPVTTADIKSFYTAANQDANGVVLKYREITKDINKYMIHGKLYLKSTDSDCDVYFAKELLDFGDNAQALASMRLGLITGSGESYIFRLDDMADTSSATKRLTVEKAGSVYGAAGLVSDPALSLSGYFAGGTLDAPAAGSSRLLHIAMGYVVSVEYFLWLEGCDENCFNDVQSKELSLSFGFVGI